VPFLAALRATAGSAPFPRLAERHGPPADYCRDRCFGGMLKPLHDPYVGKVSFPGDSKSPFRPHNQASSRSNESRSAFARSLSLDQWIDEIETRFLYDITNRIDSLPFREPLKSTLAKFGVESEDFSPPCLVDWDIYTVSIRGEICSLPFTGWFFVHYPAWRLFDSWS
jgi:hypothetical protein